MRLMNATASVALAVAGVIGGGSVAPAAWAYDASINGTFTATWVGEWARTNDVYHQEPMVRETWTITTSCVTATDCSGQVVSDGGWTAPINMHDGSTWFVSRDIPNWTTCPDGGPSYTGHEVIHFYPANPETGEKVLGSSVFAGREHTTGKPGACGTNLPLYIDQPFRLDKIG
ncbi:hypothetical protein AWB91_04395 [Mycobacterium paraense]|uniref:Secreted protein n=1 Tax=Mycobacterium paraense TaxID=767916 RepID=A0A1X2A3W8_9MYCO|nr:hypothetical protein [Mycobacterium paraense]MCV7441053.1 hypothetical protein [Mycobacterium paraense]ORW27024.1 hypothetical protein AWB91_04395 [Mycobacterium paraense]ORW36844.1 hypothetical protein AWB90_26755 [Mycobacterium paraense]ORW45392.1 hypothetical protein AWB88_04030 [Mycobacterium paraense]ORW49416.1 hypothetical protein AWB89_00460 [Mycobacterium paraense]